MGRRGEPSEGALAALKRSVELTEAMGEHAGEIEASGAERRRLWRAAHLGGVTEAQIAEANGVSEHRVYQEIRKAREEDAEGEAAAVG